MLRKSKRMAGVGLMILGSAFARSAVAGRPADGTNAPGFSPADVAPTHIIVRFKPGVVEPIPSATAIRPMSTPPRHGARRPRYRCRGRHHPREKFATRDQHGLSIPAKASHAFGACCDEVGVTGMERLYQHAFGDPVSASRHGLDRTFIVEIPPGTDPAAAAARFARLSGDIEAAFVDAIGTIAQVIPDDTMFADQYGLNNTGQTGGTNDADIDAPEAWDIHTGDPGTVTVAIVDTGIDPHIDFGGRLLEGINTVGSVPFTTETSDACATIHGTKVAGIVAAQGNNATGVAGVTWGANILPIKVFGSALCTGNVSDVVEGIMWATDHGADVINISLQFSLDLLCSPLDTGCLDFMTPLVQMMNDGVDYANNAGVLVVSAAGNIGHCNDDVCYPARLANSMAVGATDDNDAHPFFSNMGVEMDVSAPGQNILSTTAGDGYAFDSGTSFAAPHVSGLAALLKSFVPGLTNTKLRDIITNTADDLGPSGWDAQFGFGRINAHSALLRAGDPQIIGSDPPDGAVDARQPLNPDGSSVPFGEEWQWVDLTFPGDTTGLTIGDFSISENPDSGVPLRVLQVIPNGVVCRVIFNRSITVEAWTTVTHLASGTSVRIGYMPGDSDGNGVVETADLTAVADALGGGPPLPLRSIDLNRSGSTSPHDLLRGADLLGGNGPYIQYLGRSLPP